MSETEGWKRCSSCKSPIAFGSRYYVCSVSTCNRKRTGMFFCSVDCWEAHVPLMRHREAWAVEETAPSRARWKAQQDEGSDESRKKPPSASSSGTSSAPVRRRIKVGREPEAPAIPKEILVIASRFKSYVRQCHGMNTSDGVFELLSDELRRLADRAVMHAREEGRKTLLDRDLPLPPHRR